MWKKVKDWWRRQNVRPPQGYAFVQCLGCGRLLDKYQLAAHGCCTCSNRRFTMAREMSIYNSHLYQRKRLTPVLNLVCKEGDSGKNLNSYASIRRM